VAIFLRVCRESGCGSDYRLKAQFVAGTARIANFTKRKRRIPMKYILLMSSTQADVSVYQAWSQADRDAHMQKIGAIVKDLVDSGEFVSTQGLGAPQEAKIVRGEKNGRPVTDGVFPEAKEFLLGYWVIDVATPERALAVASKISAAPGPGGIPTNVPVEVRQFVNCGQA
jgi:hypothetical protein